MSKCYRRVANEAKIFAMHGCFSSWGYSGLWLIARCREVYRMPRAERELMVTNSILWGISWVAHGCP
jgi:hypothetical protein